jgi:hypothetical protein
VINDRDEPIPFNGEFSSLNPLLITANAAGARSAQIAQGIFTLFTGSTGQLGTKPGIAFAPNGEAGDVFVEAIRDLVERAEGLVLENHRNETGRVLSRSHFAASPNAEGSGPWVGSCVPTHFTTPAGG